MIASKGYRKLFDFRGRYTWKEKSRTDTMMVLSWNKANNDIKLVSFMRDIYADIPGYQSYKQYSLLPRRCSAIKGYINKYVWPTDSSLCTN